jgi:hypothetical protein
MKASVKLSGSKRDLGNACKRGIDEVMKRLSPDIIFQTDTGGQHDPGLILLPTDAGFDS